MEDEKIERLRERILQCPICIDEFKDPRILPCHHSVCLNCLLDYVRHSSSSGRLFRCPQCRQDICVPRGGVKDFPPNFYINCIQDELGSKPYFGICDVCERDWLVSQYRCVNCDLDICKFCIHEHRLFKHDVGREANIMRIETGNVGPNLVSQRTCESHADEALQMFCMTCDKLVCVSCICESHKNHDTMTLVKKLSLAQKHLQFDLDLMNEDLKLTIDSLEQLESIHSTTEKEQDQCVKAIREHARDLTLEIDNIAQKRVEEVKHRQKLCLQDIEGYTKELTGYKQHLKRVCQFLEELEDGDMSLELIENFQKFQQKTEILKKSVLHRNIKHYHIDFKPESLRKFLDIQYFRFGKLLNETISDNFMVQKKKQPIGKVRKLIGKVFRLKNFVLLCAVLTICYTIFSLSYKLFDNEATEDKAEYTIGLIFYVYLSAASLFAYLKS